MSTTTSPKHTHLFSDLFGGKKAVKTKLAQSLRLSREQARLTHDELDSLCGFNAPQRFNNISVESSRAYESSPNVLTGNIFSIASQVLGIELDEALTADLTIPQKRELVETVREDFKWIGSGGDVPQDCGKESVQETEDQVPLFVLLNVLHEIDS